MFSAIARAAKIMIRARVFVLCLLLKSDAL